MGCFFYFEQKKIIFIFISVIQFQKLTTNNVILTLTENSTLTNPIYLFLLLNQTTHQNYYFIALDTSIFKQRFNKFSVTEKIAANTLKSEVSLGHEGFYEYTIYETSLTSTSGLTTANDAIPYIVGKVEVGMWFVKIPIEEIQKYAPIYGSTIVYQPEGI